MSTYTADTIYSSFDLTPGTDNVIRLTETSGNSLDITLHQDTTNTDQPEEWFLGDDESMHATHPQLLYAIRKLLNDGTTVGCGTVSAAAAFDYTWEVVTPASSTGCYDSGLRLRATNPGNTFVFNWTHANTTFDAQILGSILSSPISDDTSVADGSDQIISFPHCAKYRLVTRDLLSPNDQAAGGIALDKTPDPYKDRQASSSRPRDRVSVIWDEGKFRRLLYEDVVAPDIHETRAREAAWAAVIGRATNDTKGTWWEVWDCLTNDRDIIVVHNSTNDLQIDTHSYEVCKLGNLDYPRLSDMCPNTQRSGGLHIVDVELWVYPAYANYDH